MTFFGANNEKRADCCADDSGVVYRYFRRPGETDDVEQEQYSRYKRGNKQYPAGNLEIPWEKIVFNSVWF